jgi:hypothetical protein
MAPQLVLQCFLKDREGILEVKIVYFGGAVWVDLILTN